MLQDEGCSLVRPKQQPWGMWPFKFLRPAKHRPSKKCGRLLIDPFPLRSSSRWTPINGRGTLSASNNIARSCMPEIKETTRLRDLWDEQKSEQLSGDQLALLRYRSNLLGADLRITNFGGGNTSSKIELPDPFTGNPVRVLAVKGSGGDIGSIKESGFALLYLDRVESLKKIYRGEEHEDEMVGYYPLSAFGESRVAASIDTPLHAFIPYDHVDHLHPDWAIAIAASANGKRKLDEFNREFGRKIVWLPWQRPGFELALMIESAVKDNPGAEGVLLGSHGLFTWGRTQQECYTNSIQTIDEMGQFIR